MKTLIWSIFIMLALLSTVPVRAAEVIVGKNNGWTVFFNDADATCVGTPHNKEGIFYFQRAKDDLVLIFGSPKLSWVADGKDYPTIVRTDGRGWNGVLQGFKSAGAYGLSLSSPAGEFLRAIRAAARISIEADGATYGPYSLKGSSETMAWLQQCISQRDAGGFKPEKPISLEPNVLTSWDESYFGKSFYFGKWMGKIQKQTNLDDTTNVFLHVTEGTRELGVIKLEGKPDGGYGEIGVFSFGLGTQGVVLSSFTGGAHCCSEVAIGIIGPSGMEVLKVGSFDGEGIVVKDVDGDGVYELFTTDQRFLYGFGPYAEASPPLVITQVDGAKLTDVTRQPKYAAFLRNSLLRSLRILQNNDEASDGQIAGILAEASSVGMFNTIRLSLDEQLKRSPNEVSSECGPPDCASPTKFLSLNDAIATRLNAWGYGNASRMDTKAKDFFSGFAAFKSIGNINEQTENSCKNVPSRITVKGPEVASFTGYEMECDFESARQLGSSVLAIGLCSGEGDYWVSNYLFEKAGEDLLMTSWNHDLSEAAAAGSAQDRLKPCH